MSSISINQLPRIEEVNTGDLFLIQTPSSSNTLDFKDLIIGLENTTFANTISTFNTNIEILSADVGNLSAKAPSWRGEQMVEMPYLRTTSDDSKSSFKGCKKGEGIWQRICLLFKKGEDGFPADFLIV